MSDAPDSHSLSSGSPVLAPGRTPHRRALRTSKSRRGPGCQATPPPGPLLAHYAPCGIGRGVVSGADRTKVGDRVSSKFRRPYCQYGGSRPGMRVVGFRQNFVKISSTGFRQNFVNRPPGFVKISSKLSTNLGRRSPVAEKFFFSVGMRVVGFRQNFVKISSTGFRQNFVNRPPGFRQNFVKIEY